MKFNIMCLLSGKAQFYFADQELGLREFTITLMFYSHCRLDRAPAN